MSMQDLGTPAKSQPAPVPAKPAFAPFPATSASGPMRSAQVPQHTAADVEPAPGGPKEGFRLPGEEEASAPEIPKVSLCWRARGCAERLEHRPLLPLDRHLLPINLPVPGPSVCLHLCFLTWNEQGDFIPQCVLCLGPTLTSVTMCACAAPSVMREESGHTPERKWSRNKRQHRKSLHPQKESSGG